MGGAWQCKWEAYCATNGRSTDNVSLSSERGGTESTAIQIGGLSGTEMASQIAATMVAASGLATIPLQKSQGFSLCWPPKKSLAASDFEG